MCSIEHPTLMMSMNLNDTRDSEWMKNNRRVVLRENIYDNKSFILISTADMVLKLLYTCQYFTLFGFRSAPSSHKRCAMEIPSDIQSHSCTGKRSVLFVIRLLSSFIISYAGRTATWNRSLCVWFGYLTQWIGLIQPSIKFIDSDCMKIGHNFLCFSVELWHSCTVIKIHSTFWAYKFKSHVSGKFTEELFTFWNPVILGKATNKLSLLLLWFFTWNVPSRENF